MILATTSQYDAIVDMFKEQRRLFPHIRLDYITSMIHKNKCVYEDGIVIMFNKYKRNNRIGDVVAPKDSYTIKQIVNKTQGNGNAQKILASFLTEVKTDVYLSVRADNTRAIAFYLKNNFVKVGAITWKDGTISGHVYCWKYTNSSPLA